MSSPATPPMEQEQHMQCLLCYYGDGFSHPLCSREYSSYQLLSRLLHQERLRRESGRCRAELLPALDLINFNQSVQPSIFWAAARARCYCLKLPYSASSTHRFYRPVIGQRQHTTAWDNMFDHCAGNLRLLQLTLLAQHSQLNGFMSLNLNLQP